jgi:hypothetical protein
VQNLLQNLLTDFSVDALLNLSPANMLAFIILALTFIAIVWLGVWLLAHYIGLFVLPDGIRSLYRRQR